MTEQNRSRKSHNFSINSCSHFKVHSTTK